MHFVMTCFCVYYNSHLFIVCGLLMCSVYCFWCYINRAALEPRLPWDRTAACSVLERRTILMNCSAPCHCTLEYDMSCNVCKICMSVFASCHTFLCNGILPLLLCTQSSRRLPSSYSPSSLNILRWISKLLANILWSMQSRLKTCIWLYH